MVPWEFVLEIGEAKFKTRWQTLITPTQITRFVNHHCKPNLDVQFITYGRRRCIAFVAGRNIAPGEQLFIHYGDDYFGKRRPCICNVVPYPHVPAKGSEPPLRVQASVEQLESWLTQE